MRLSIEHTCLPARGEHASGDAIYLRQDADALFFCVIDVLGHGPRAAEVAGLAAEHLDSLDANLGATECMQSLHAALRGTRGAAATLGIVVDHRIQGCGVGNVELRTTSRSPAIMLSPGILGQHIRSLRCFEGSVAPGDRLICFSDGISQRLALSDFRHMDAKATCEVIMQRHRRAHDDASVLVIDVEEA